MPAEKRTRAHQPNSLPAASGSMPIFSTVVGALVNMAVTAVTSGSVLEPAPEI